MAFYSSYLPLDAFSKLELDCLVKKTMLSSYNESFRQN